MLTHRNLIVNFEFCCTISQTRPRGIFGTCNFSFLPMHIPQKTCNRLGDAGLGMKLLVAELAGAAWRVGNVIAAAEQQDYWRGRNCWGPGSSISRAQSSSWCVQWAHSEEQENAIWAPAGHSASLPQQPSSEGPRICLLFLMSKDIFYLVNDISVCWCKNVQSCREFIWAKLMTMARQQNLKCSLEGGYASQGS